MVLDLGLNRGARVLVCLLLRSLNSYVLSALWLCENPSHRGDICQDGIKLLVAIRLKYSRLYINRKEIKVEAEEMGNATEKTLMPAGRILEPKAFITIYDAY